MVGGSCVGVWLGGFREGSKQPDEGCLGCADPAPLQVYKKSAGAQGGRCTRWGGSAGASAALQPVTIRIIIMMMVSRRTPMMMNVATRFR